MQQPLTISVVHDPYLGRPFVVDLKTGYRAPVVRGGSTPPPPADPPADPPEGAPADPPADPPPPGGKPPAKPAEAAPERTPEQLLAESRKWEQRAKANKEAADELAKLKAATATDTEKAVAAAKAETLAAANARILRAEVKALAGTAGFADPADAAAFLDLSGFEPDETGDFDAAAITAALKGVLKRKPYLAKSGGGGAGHGNPGFGNSGIQPGSPEDRASRLAAAEKAGNQSEVVRLRMGGLLGSLPTT